MDIENFTIDTYKNEIDRVGLKKVWECILDNYSVDKISTNSIIHFSNFGKIYEIGIGYANKEDKKCNGVFYTPKDVANLLCEYFENLEGEIICDVCCGVGNLILAYLERVGREKSLYLLSNGFVYLYDSDEIALEICKRTIGFIYGRDMEDKLHICCEDFMNKEVVLPYNCKVISNPPYHKILKTLDSWENTNVLIDSKELYSIFMEKIIRNSVSSVIITPFGFINGEKFYSLRLFLNSYNGTIFSFDNIPGNIFHGRKEGIFNTNISNSVRAAITIVENKEGLNGFRVSPLLRFKTCERFKLLNKSVLDSYIGENSEYQIVDESNKQYYKCFSDILPVLKIWMGTSNMVLDDVVTQNETDFRLVIPKSLRYYTSASIKDLERDCKFVLYFNNETIMDFVYCLFNSSFVYLYWRIYDGAFQISDKLLKSVPIFYDMLSKKDINKMKDIVSLIKENEDEYYVYKKNSSKVQENLKIPKKYRDILNKFLFDVLGIIEGISILDKIHSNSLFSTNEVN